MKAKKILAMVLCVAMVLSTMGFTVLAEDTDIIKVGTGKTYETWSAAVAAATDADSDGVITYHVYGKVLMDIHNVKGTAATINIIGKTDDAELSVETANPTDNGIVYVSDNTIETVNFSKLKLSRPNGEYKVNEGQHNRFFTVWDSDGSTDLITYTNCVFPNGSGNNQYGKTTYTNCIFNNDVYYALWIYGSGNKGVVEVTGCKFDADRGVKIYSEDSSATVSTTITDSTFAIDSKPAIVSSIAGELVVEDVDATECEYGLLASEPKDGRADLESAAITVDGEEPVFVAKVGNMVCTDMDYAQSEANSKNNDSDPNNDVTVEIPVAKIGTKYYTTVQAAINAAVASNTENIVVELLNDAVLDITAWDTLAIGGENTKSITINGNDKTLTFNKKNSDWNHIATNNDAKLILNDMTITDSGYNNGPWNRYDLNFACDVELNDVTATKALAFKSDATLKNVKINEVGDNYAIWITSGGQNVTIDGLEITSAGRGIKIDEQYQDAPSKVELSVKNATFATEKKAAILVKSAAGADVEVENVDITNVKADNVNAVWVDSDSSVHYGKVTVTGANVAVEGAEDFVALVASQGKVEGYYATLQEAINAATDGDTIDLLGGTVDLPEVNSLKITKDITIENGTIDITDGVWNGNSIIEVYGGTADDFVVATFNNVDFVGNNYSSAFGVIYAYNYGKVVINGCDFDLSNEKYSAGGVLKGNGVDVSAFDVTNSTFDLENPNRIIANATVNLEGVKIDAVVTDDTLVVGTMNNHAFRNVVGNVNNTDIYVDGFETGIKNTVDNEVLTVTDSKIKVTNTPNGNPGIYLTGRDKLVDTNSTIDATIFIDVVEGEDVVLNTLSFETNGGNAIPSVVRNQGEVVDLSGYKPEKSGYTFVGWYSDEALTQSVTTVTLDSPVTVYAKWNQNVTGGGSGGVARYTVVFVTNGGTSIDKISNLKNRTVDLAEYTTEKEGYTFEGWYTDKELTNKVTSVKLTDDITLYAKWVEIETQPGTDEPGTTEGGNLFADVKTTDWFYENVKYVVENELMNGVDEDKFAPNDTLTRAMLVTVLYRLDGEPVVENASFTDVDADAYYANAVSWAKQNGIVNGVTENEFAPNSDITREQIAAILYRYAQFKGFDVSVGENTDISSYADAESVSEYAAASIQYAVGSGLIKGKSATTLNPLDNATRAEIAAILQRFIEGSNN